jgi:diguanylate cyclase (GGDEF)-like protein/PAS domain S-box-containing protein
MFEFVRHRPSSVPEDSAPEAAASKHDEAAHTTPLRRLWWAALVLLGLSTGAVGWTIWQLRNDAVRNTTADAGNIAAVLASQLSRSLTSIDTVLLEISRSSKDRDIGTPSKLRAAFERKEMYESLKQHLTRLPHLFNIVVADANGQLVVSTAAWPTADINVADREYFDTARVRTDGQLTISVPFKNRVDDSLTIVFARRLENAGGSFAGVVFASVNFRYFEAIYQSAESIQSALFTLVRRDGIILYRYPRTEGFVGRKLSGYAIFDDAVTSGAKGFQLLAKADGVIRYISLRQVSDYPLFVNISVSQGVALAGWLRRSIAIGFGSATLLLCSIYLLVAITRQVRRLSASETALRESKNIIGAMLDAVPARIFWKDKNLVFLGCNAPFARDAGFARPEDIVGKDDYQMGWREQANLYRSDDRQVIASGSSKLLIEEPQTSPEGTVNTLLTSKVPLRDSDGEIFGVLGTYVDVTERKRLEEQLSLERRRHEDKISHMAHHDALTDLPNRILFYEKMDELLRHQPQGRSFAVLSVDLDHFKGVNDALGHPIGDKLLQAVATRMRGCVRETDMVARLGGDEFAILQATFAERADASSLATRLIDSVSAPYLIGGHQVAVGISVGIAIAPEDGTASDQLMKNADLALYRCKADGGSRYQFFEPQMDASREERLSLELDLRKASANGEFSVNYQPVVDLKTGMITACEALVRWHHPGRGWVPPQQFIPIAEETGLIVAIGEWVLRRACADAVDWPDDITIAVNVSPVQFRDSDFVRTVTSALESSRLPARRLELEITERVLIQDNIAALAVLRRLKDLGASIAMDDFGTGHSSLSYLRSFPFDRIKIDQTFIHDLPKSKDSLAIVRSVVGLSRSLGIVTTAEGVETRDQLEVLRTEGCTEAQGYFFSPPKEVAEIKQLLTSLRGLSEVA